MLESKENNEKKVLEEKIRIYKKNNKALCDLLTLYFWILKKENGSLAFYTLADTVIKNLEDPEINIPLKATSVAEVLRDDSNKFYDILHELKESEYERLYQNFNQDFRTWHIEMFYRQNEVDNKPFDFIESLCEYSMNWTSEFLVSDIDISKRAEFLKNIIVNFSSDMYIEEFKYLLASDKAGCDLSRTTIDKKKEKVDELIKYMKKFDSSKEFKVNLFQNIVKNNRYYLNWIEFLQETGLVNFMDIRGSFNEENENFEISPCYYLLKNGKVESFKFFYESKDYLNLPGEIRNNDDMILLKNISINEIPKFISLSNFNITTGRIKLIANRILETQKENNYCDTKCPYPIKNSIEKLLLDIENAIIHKAKNKQEYRIMCRFAKLFHECANYEPMYLKEQYEKLQLENKRKDFVGLMKTVSDNLMETVPARKKIKDIKF